jgi:hypothetical protein
MEKLVRIALAVFFLAGIASAQSIPPIDVFAGYSYFNLQVPTSAEPTVSQRLALNGWEFSTSVRLLHSLSVEGDISGHLLGTCAGVADLTCSNFSYMFGPRYTLGDHSSKISVFVHGLVGQDSADLPISSSSSYVNDTSLALAAGGGVDYWFHRHVGLQLGPVDYFFTRHLNNFDAPSQTNIRISAGLAFRFGGNIPPAEPKAPKQVSSEPESHRSWTRPWHKTTTAPSAPSESQPSTVAVNRQPQRQATMPAPVSGHGMTVESLGLAVAPQEFDGAKIMSIAPGSIAENASLKVGDLIKSVDGKPVRTPMELAAELSDKSGKVRIGIQRGDWSTETLILLPSR